MVGSRTHRLVGRRTVALGGTAARYAAGLEAAGLGHKCVLLCAWVCDAETGVRGIM